MTDGFVTVSENALVKYNADAVPNALQSIDERLAFIEALSRRIVVQTKNQERNTVKSYHWVTVAVVLIVVYLVGVKYPSIGQSALSKVGL